ncbi:MAG TPA: hypothetical protein VLY03_01615 [Bacteroidota bacterium]|nr:hypothetical protein [Bacteroidota bacterium]
MRISHAVHLFFLLLSCCQSLTIAQIDSLGNVDPMSESDEEIIEQTANADESPIMDYLHPEMHEGDEHLTIRSRMRSTLDPSRAYADGYYSGNALQSCQRLDLYAGVHLSGGLLVKKDPGERMLNDFSTGNIALSDVGVFSKVILGDYFVEGGEGIALWRNMDAGKGSNVAASAVREGRGLMPFASASESGFFRGVAAQLSLGAGTFTLLLSKKPENAYLDSLGRVTGLYTGGYFRTTSELEKRNTLTDQLVGGRIQYHLSDDILFGSTYYHSTFSRPFLVDNGDVFGGTSLSMGAVDFRVTSGIASFFGEWGVSNSSACGISGVKLMPNQSITVVTSFRSFPQRFISLHGFGFGERSFDERGAYMGVSLRIREHLRLSSYIDEYAFPSASSSLFGTSGHDFLVQSEYIPHRKIEIILRYQQKYSDFEEENLTCYGLMNRSASVQSVQHLRIQVGIRISPEVRLSSRGEETILKSTPAGVQQKGWMTYQDLVVRMAKWATSNVRLAVFHTDSYDTRVYELERDFPGVCSMPGLYGRGMKWYVLLFCPVTEFFRFSLKYSELVRDDVKRIGTGEDQLPSNRDRRIGLQLDAKF